MWSRNPLAGASGYVARPHAGADLAAALRRCGKPVLLIVEHPQERGLADWSGFSHLSAVCVNPGERLRDWFLMRRDLERLGVPVGYADHQPEPWLALNSALAHAPVIVKGLTLNRSLGGEEHRGSLYPDEFASLVEFVRDHERTIEASDAAHQSNGAVQRIESLVAARPLSAGSLIEPGDLKTVPGLLGLTASTASRLVGRRLLFDRQPDEPITFGVTEPWPGRSGEAPLDVAVVIRAKNEAAWLRRSLAALLNQRRPPKEILIVDNDSTDDTVAVASHFAQEADVRLCAIADREFSFGRALNRGIAAASTPWVVSLSAHCIPVHDRWLEALLVRQCQRPFVAGVYGRQEPLPDTTDFDKRDLWTTFGPEPRDQRGQDYFFHNANSLIRKEVWARIPFDESLNGVEDRDWAKKVLADGYHLMYTPLASVHHYHGIHQGRNEARARRVVKVIELIQQREAIAG
jgi:GT2 family glycosyltransferase